MFINFLPPESAVSTAMRNAAAESGVVSSGPAPDPAQGTWSLDAMLLASVIDELRWSRYEFRQVNSSDAGKAPDQVPRPGVGGKRQKKTMTMDQRRMLDPRLRGDWNG